MIRAGKRKFLTGLFEAAVAAADPMRALTGNLPERPGGRTVVTGAYKGAAQLASGAAGGRECPLPSCPTR